MFTASRARTFIAYFALIGATVFGFFLVKSAGASLTAHARAVGPAFGEAAGTAASMDALPRILLALVIIIAAARTAGALLQRLHQPPVIGEVIAGIALGPSLLGRIAPELQAALLPSAIAPHLGILAQIGVILFMFLVGLELDLKLLRHKTHATVAISHASIVVPFLLGSTLALYVYPQLSYGDVPFTVFALFMGASMSITAFPVLARILGDRGIRRTRIGGIAIACAAVDDVSAWCLLAFVVGVARAEPAHAFVTLALSAAYIAVMFFAARPLITRFVTREKTSKATTSVILVSLLLSSFITEWIGVHAVFGAFVLGALIPHDAPVAEELGKKIEDLVVIVFLPAFFAFTGMRTELGLISGAESWFALGLVVSVACLGKFGGSYAASRFAGLGARDSAIIGVLMNTRGLMELIVLNVGLDLRVISPKLFAIMVLMALATTFMTTPILHLLTRDSEGLDRAFAPASE